MTMTLPTYQRGKSPWTISCNPQCESDGKSTARRKAIRAAFYKVHASGSFSFNDESTWPAVQTMVCHRCGKNHSGQAKTQPAKVETASQNGQAFDAMGDAWDNINMETGKFPSGFSTQLASRIRDAIGCSFADARPRATKVCNAVKREWKIDGPSGFLPAGVDTAAQTLKFIQHISPPQTKPAPKAQPAPKADGSIEVMDAELFARLAKAVSVEMMTIEIETITVNGKVFRCA